MAASAEADFVEEVFVNRLIPARRLPRPPPQGSCLCKVAAHGCISRSCITTSDVKVSKIWSLCCRALGQVGDSSLLDPMSSQNGSSHRPVFNRPWQCQRRGGQVRFCAHPCPFSSPVGNNFQRCWMVKVKPNTPLQLVSTGSKSFR